MNESILLSVFYNEMRARSASHDQVFLNIDESMVKLLKENYKIDASLQELESLADICIANEWLERTTADPYYNYLSLTKNGLDRAIDFVYKNK